MNTAKLEKKLVKTKQIVKVNNEQFEASTAAEKRVMVAKDILARVKSQQYRPTSCTWVELPNLDLYDISSKERKNISLQKKIVEEEEKCKCCGVGAIILSCVAFNNNATGEDLERARLEYQSIRRSRNDKFGLKELFTPRQLALIEVAFECGDGYYSRENRLYKVSEFDALYTKYFPLSSDERMIAIMKNIVRNKGEFII